MDNLNKSKPGTCIAKNISSAKIGLSEFCDLINKYAIIKAINKDPLFPKKHLFLKLRQEKKDKDKTITEEISTNIPFKIKIKKILIEYKDA